MRVLMGVIKNRHGTYYAQKLVPKRLRLAAAEVLGRPVPREDQQFFLKRSLGTKDRETANRRAKAVLIEFDKTLEQAEARLKPLPLRETLNPTEVKRVGDWVYAKLLSDDEAWRIGGRKYLAHREVQLRQEGVELRPLFDTGTLPEFGVSEDQLEIERDNVGYELGVMQNALARGDISAIQDDLDIALDDLGIRLDPKSDAYRKAGSEVLRRYVEALFDLKKRNSGRPVPTPEFSSPHASHAGVPTEGLRAAYVGWQKERQPAPGTEAEFKRAIDLFIELHGDLPLTQIRKRHAVEFRQALQDMPRHRSGLLHKASLPELVAWGKAHPKAKKIAVPTINKLIGGVQTVGLWAASNGMIPDEVTWADPFASTRLEKHTSKRGPFLPSELKAIFDSPVFRAGERPAAGKGEAAFWLPLLALFTGARRGELTSLTTNSVARYEGKGAYLLSIVEDLDKGVRLKTVASTRVIPLHPELIRIGFVRYVEHIRSTNETAWLFPDVAPSGDGAKAWSKWFTRYLRSLGINDPNKVFHSFRHNFKDALRKASPDEELRDALAGHSNEGSVSRGYGAKTAVQRFGVKALVATISKVKYAGLDLSHVKIELPKSRKGQTNG